MSPGSAFPPWLSVIRATALRRFATFREGTKRPLPWQSIKAVSRRYAEGFDDGYEIPPASNLLNAMTLAIGKFLENPVG
jgi:hypothetical protein